MFCPKCGSILLPKKDDRKIIMGCGNCRYTSQKKEKLVLHEQRKPEEKEAIEVIDNKNPDILPKTPESCPKCNHKEAFYWTVQTRAGDEAETRFFKCVKCEHTWRLY
ncbi:MAG: transcription factor S [Nanoarchaeota archaeon]|nr:transcription factor S [Nanoarchaeota archaeon]